MVDNARVDATHVPKSEGVTELRFAQACLSTPR